MQINSRQFVINRFISFCALVVIIGVFNFSNTYAEDSDSIFNNKFWYLPDNVSTFYDPDYSNYAKNRFEFNLSQHYENLYGPAMGPSESAKVMYFLQKRQYWLKSKSEKIKFIHTTPDISQNAKYILIKTEEEILTGSLRDSYTKSATQKIKEQVTGWTLRVKHIANDKWIELNKWIIIYALPPLENDISPDCYQDICPLRHYYNGLRARNELEIAQVLKKKRNFSQVAKEKLYKGNFSPLFVFAGPDINGNDWSKRENFTLPELHKLQFLAFVNWELYIGEVVLNVAPGPGALEQAAKLAETKLAVQFGFITKLLLKGEVKQSEKIIEKEVVDYAVPKIILKTAETNIITNFEKLFGFAPEKMFLRNSELQEIESLYFKNSKALTKLGVKQADNESIRYADEIGKELTKINNKVDSFFASKPDSKKMEDLIFASITKNDPRIDSNSGFMIIEESVPYGHNPKNFIFININNFTKYTGEEGVRETYRFGEHAYVRQLFRRWLAKNRPRSRIYASPENAYPYSYIEDDVINYFADKTVKDIYHDRGGGSQYVYAIIEKYMDKNKVSREVAEKRLKEVIFRDSGNRYAYSDLEYEVMRIYDELGMKPEHNTFKFAERLHRIAHESDALKLLKGEMSREEAEKILRKNLGNSIDIYGEY